MIPSLCERCAETILSHGLEGGTQQDIHESVLNRIWDDLKTKVPQNALGLQTAMSDIETLSVSNPPNNDNPSELKKSDCLRKLTQVFSAEFQEAGIVLNNRVPCSCSEYDRIQSILEKKWTDEGLLTIWGNKKYGLANVLNEMGAFRNRSIPKDPKKIRIWMSRSRREIYLNRVAHIDLNKLDIKVCPSEINRFHSLQTINLNSNRLRSFSCDLRACSHLKTLLLFNNQIQSFAPDLSTNTALEILELSQNRLRKFCLDLKSCTELRCLNLSFNRIEDFSSDLSACTQLKTLNLSFNRLKKFPYDLAPQTKSTRIFLSRNPIVDPVSNTPPGFRRSREMLAPIYQSTNSTPDTKPKRTRKTAPL